MDDVLCCGGLIVLKNQKLCSEQIIICISLVRKVTLVLILVKNTPIEEGNV